MEEILEIRDGCKTPTQLLKSKAFSIYLEIYKKQFIKELENREDSTIKEEVLHKIDYMKNNKVCIVTGASRGLLIL